MLPTDGLAKNGSREFKIFIGALGLTFIIVNIFQAHSQYKLSKVNRRLSEKQIKKLESEGF